MRKQTGKRRAVLWGAVSFFALVALVIQIAVMIYDAIRQKTEHRGWIALWMLVVIVCLSSLCVVFDALRRKYTVDKPVERILAATEKIAAGDFTVRLEPVHPYGKYDEFDLIMEDFNVMAAELKKSEILKKDFISNVSHELKTPLSVIRGYAAMLGGELDKETREYYVNALTGATDRLTALVGNVLKLNKLENQKIKPEMETIDLAAALEECIVAFEEKIDEKSLRLSCDLEKVTVYSSKSYLEIVWNNLLSNAIKFTPSGGEIRVAVKKTESGAAVLVSDTGLGIPAENGARIFEKFYQGETSHQGEGNGLGLALVKKVIDVLGGEIFVESEEGKGSTFTIVLKDVKA